MTASSLSLVVPSTLICGARISLHDSFSCCRAWALEPWLSRCGAQLSRFQACGILVPGPEIKPVSPALASGFLTTEPPGKFQEKRQFKHWLMFVFLALAGQRSVSAPAQPVLCHCPTFLVPRKHVVGGV